MPPLEIEIRHPKEDRWTKIHEVGPNESVDIMVLRPDGIKEIMLFECSPDGSESSIKRTEAGDKSFLEPNKMPVLHPDKPPIEVARLRAGDSFETTIQEIDVDLQQTRHRFTHR